MRILIHNVDTFLGKALVQEMRKRGAEGGLHRVFGTLASRGGAGEEKAPKLYKIVARDDPKKRKKMEETIRSCKVVVMDLFSSTVEDIQFTIKALGVEPAATGTPTPIGEPLEEPVTFVLISSAMVWAGTKAGRDGFLREGDYKRRKPVAGSKYEQWKELEDLVLNSFNQEGSMVKAFVVAGGALYGQGEDTFGQLFKNAWCGIQEHVILSPGTNRIPTVHVQDLARLVRQVGNAGEALSAAETPYLLAVDQPPAAEGQKQKPSTQAELVQCIVNEMCEAYDVPVVPKDQFGASADREPAADGTEDETAQLEALKETMVLNLCMEPSAVMLAEDFAAECEPPGWLCRDGLLQNIQTVAGEFCKARELRPMKVLIAGPPASGKDSLAQAVSEHFKIPKLELDNNDVDSMATRLCGKVCKYRGYVLDAGSAGFQEVERLFRVDEQKPVEDDEEAAAGGDDDEEAPKISISRVLNADLCPAFVIVTQAPEAFCRGRWTHRGGALPEFQQKMDLYTRNNPDNASGGSSCLADFFMDYANIGVFNLPVPGKDAEDIFESARIYMESRGRPFNYLPSEEEVAREILARRVEKEQEGEKLNETQAVDTAAGEAKKKDKEVSLQAERMRIISKHMAAHQELKDMPLREYLMRYMVPNLTEGLIEMCKVAPDNPVDYLATYLEERVEGGTSITEKPA